MHSFPEIPPTSKSTIVCAPRTSPADETVEDAAAASTAAVADVAATAPDEA